ncbi:MAG: PP2C family protein-serine/threonine phosphatase [Planctomycetota bacterium]
MDISTRTVLREQLLDRRNRLRVAVEQTGEVADLTRLLQEVDRALGRMDAGSFGQCEICREDVAEENLVANPLIRYCLCELSHEQQRALENDLGLASRIQAALLPDQDLRAAGWEAHYRYRPAGPVSGDYCDLLTAEEGDGDLLFVVGDVSGKGVAASLVMAHLNASFRSLAGLDLPVQELLTRTNRLLLESTIASHYATLVCGRARASGEVEMSNAGHLPALVVRRGRVDRIESVGLPVGMFTGQSYEVKLVRLDPGDTLFLCTDGLTEARNADEQDYGVECIAAMLSDFHSQKPRDLAETCLSGLDDFLSGTRQQDDVTVMVLRRL